MTDELAEMRKDYDYDGDMFSGEEQRSKVLKQIMRDRLTSDQASLLVLYINDGSYRKVGARFNIPHSTIYKELKNIINIVKHEFENRT